jgi:ADP-heptose:LPS heptosyltransferase
MEIIKRKPTVVVIRQLGGVGDVISLSCVYRGLRETYPDHHVINITTDIYLAGALKELGHHNPLIDEVICISPYEEASSITKKWHPQYKDATDIMDEVIVQRAKLALDLNAACMVREHAECARYGTVVTPRYKIWCDAAKVVPSSYAPIYEITPEEQNEADQWWYRNFDGKPFLRDLSPTGTPIVGLGLVSANPQVDGRTIDLEKLELIAHGLQNRGVYVITVDTTLKIDGVPYIVGKRLQELMPIIKRMSAFVTVDSGLLHMAGTVGTPVVGMFGSTDYRMRMAYYRGSAIDSKSLVPCAYCWYSKPCMRSPNKSDHMKCLKLIEPSNVTEETMRWVNYIRLESKGTALPMIG